MHDGASAREGEAIRRQHALLRDQCESQGRLVPYRAVPLARERVKGRDGRRDDRHAPSFDSSAPFSSSSSRMPGGLGYDEQGSLATYFALTFLSLAIIPSTIWSLRPSGPFSF